MRRDEKSGVILPEAALYEHDLEADHWDVHQYWLSSPSAAHFPGRRDLPAGITMSEVVPEWGFARQMYWDVGGPWIWGDRRAYSDQQWQDYVALPGFRQFKLFLKDGVLGGYAETSLDPESGIGCLEYFGLLPNAVGQGAGPAFLSQIIGNLWDEEAREVQISTCTLDHPGAFRVYCRNGFDRLSSHFYTMPNPVKARIISPEEFQIRAKLLG